MKDKNMSQQFYQVVWRWHFYAATFVIPFFLVLSITGLIMVYFNSIESRYGEILYVTPQKQTVTVEKQLQAVKLALPKGNPVQYIAPIASNRAALFQISENEQTFFVAVNPYSAEILKVINKNDTIFYIASQIHSTLLIGTFGDRLLEIAAGLGIAMLISGLYLWWPRGTGVMGTWIPRLHKKGHIFWKDLHVSTGVYISIALLFFLLSGMAWTGVWGGYIVQPYSSFPAEKFLKEIPLSDNSHASMNHGEVNEVPWGLEQTPMPMSGSNAGLDGVKDLPITLTGIIDFAKQLGFREQFRLDLPQSDTGVYTLSITSAQGDSQNPTIDRTVHIDQHTGKILADIRYNDYSLMAKSMAVGIALHQGDLGWWNTLANVLVCLSVIFLCISGFILWWLRRPKNTSGLNAPKHPSNMPFFKSAFIIILLVSAAFPLAGVVIITALIVDLFFIKNKIN